MNLRESVIAKQDALLNSLQQAIRIRSVQGEAAEGCPYGRGVRSCLDLVLDIGRKLGLSCTDMDHQVGWAEYGNGPEMIAVVGHLDVVPEGEGWSFDPYGGEIHDGKIFGRGTMDDKGPTIAALYALAAIRDSGLPIRRRIRLLFGTNEETGSRDMKYYLAHGGEAPVMGFTPDGEYPVINGEKGIVNVTFRKTFTQDGPVRLKKLYGGSAPNVVPASAGAVLSCPLSLSEKLAAESTGNIRFTPCPGGVTIEASGVSAHGSTPELGENAIGRLMQALSRLPLSGEAASAIRFLAEKIGMETGGESLGIALRDDISGRLTLNWGTVSGDETSLTLCINYRYPVTKRFEDCDPVLQAAFTGAGFETVSCVHKNSLYVPEDSELIRTLLSVYARETGLPAVPKSIGGGTYAKCIPNIVAFGPIFPGDEVREHKPDEFIEIDKLMKNAQIIAEAMYQLAK